MHHHFDMLAIFIHTTKQKIEMIYCTTVRDKNSPKTDKQSFVSNKKNGQI